MTQNKTLRERIREAGGLYSYVNSRLIKIAGPAQVGGGPKELPVHPCGYCGRPKDEHIERDDGSLRCPSEPVE
ncbi:MAG: hypothetical protein ACTH32_10840 [Microbacterium gubbeenense]|uniref:hypothetical protein n=1 Tax=Microbacterium gubbeenense TaxID=159896 RepID=UPI003F9AE2FE